MTIKSGEGWMTPIIKYLTGENFLKEKTKAHKIRRLTDQYIMVAGNLYKRGRSTPMLRCIYEKEVSLVLAEVHSGTCGRHIRGR